MVTNNATTAPVRVGLISLGCAKNLVDAEIMLGSLLKAGMEITNEAGAGGRGHCQHLFVHRRRAGGKRRRHFAIRRGARRRPIPPRA